MNDARPNGRISVWLKWGGRGFSALADQGLFAGTNFLVNVLCARWLDEEAYGAFVIAYISIFAFITVVHTALIREPMAVFGSGRYYPALRSYLKVLLKAHWLLMAPAAIVLLAAAGAASLFEDSGGVPAALLALIPAAPMILLFWIARRIFYVQLRPVSAAIGGLLYLALLSTAVFVLHQRGLFSPASALLAMGGAAAAASLLLLAIAKSGIAEDSAAGPTLPETAGRHWNYGRWVLGTGLLSLVPNAGYFLILPPLIGIEGLAALRALFNLVMPVLHSISALSGLLVPIFGARRRQGRAVRGTMSLFLAIYLGGAGLYFVGLLIFGEELVAWLYDGKYTEYAFLLPWVGVLLFSTAISQVLGEAFRAMEKSSTIFWCYLGAAVATALFGPWLAWKWGLPGALSSMLAASFVTSCAMVLFWMLTASETGKS